MLDQVNMKFVLQNEKSSVVKDCILCLLLHQPYGQDCIVEIFGCVYDALKIIIRTCLDGFDSCALWNLSKLLFKLEYIVYQIWGKTQWMKC